MNLKTDLFILVNGNQDIVMDVEDSYGKTALFMKVIGKIIWHMVKGD